MSRILAEQSSRRCGTLEPARTRFACREWPIGNRFVARRPQFSGKTGSTTVLTVAGSSRSLMYNSVPFGRGTLSALPT